MPSHPLDFHIQANVFATPELLAVFDESRRFARWLAIEAALAATQAELGIIPKEAAAAIAQLARPEALNWDTVRRAYTTSGNSLVPVVKALREASGEAGQYVHYGATTQDILDTAQILEIKEALAILYRDLRRLEEAILTLTRTHRATPMMGRTHGQQALPITFGLKLAVWLAELRRHVERLKSLAPRLFVGQMAGAVGTGAAFGSAAREIGQRTMARLGLGFSPLAWHTARDTMAETANLLAMMSATGEKMAGEVMQLAKTEIGELHEGGGENALAGSSSTMPHKKNPVLCGRVAVLARHVRALAGVALDAMVHEHERDTRALWSEWLAMPQICMYTGAALGYLVTIFSHLRVAPERMLDNLRRHGDAALSEWLVFRLAGELGRTPALEMVQGLLRRVLPEERRLEDIIRDEPALAPLLTSADFDMLAHPERYTGEAIAIADTIIAASEKARATDPDIFGS